jgi:outer membrane receptor protein involved in Fe transport
VARIYGFEGGATWQPSAAVKLEALYLWDRATVVEFDATPELAGKRLPQVPEHRISLQADVSLPHAFRVAVSGRFVGDQFDDDRNELVLDRYFRLDAELSRSLGESARLFVALENLTDTTIITNRSPVAFIGAPFQVRGGFYFRLHRPSF